MKRLLLILVSAFVITGCSSEKKGLVEILETNANWDFPEAKQIVCRFSTILEVKPETQDDGSEKVSYSIDEQSKPIEIHFGFNADGDAVIYGNAGQNTLAVSKNDEEGIVLIERSEYGYVFTYTIFRDRGIGYWTKTNEAFGTSYSFISVGRCWGEA
jgi:hypothetical protein